MAFQRPPKVHRCDFCEAPLEDPMLGFLEHIEQSASCRNAWVLWRENVKRETGGT